MKSIELSNKKREGSFSQEEASLYGLEPDYHSVRKNPLFDAGLYPGSLVFFGPTGRSSGRRNAVDRKKEKNIFKHPPQANLNELITPHTTRIK